MKECEAAIEGLLQRRGQARCVACFATFKEEEAKLAFLKDNPSTSTSASHIVGTSLRH